jgi:AraC-like DNA-binding protein
MTVSSILVNSLIHEISKYEISYESIIENYKIDSQKLTNPDERIQLEKYRKIEADACELSKNPYFFLDYGKSCFQLSPLIKYLIATENNYYGMLSQFIRYSKLLNESFVFELTDFGDTSVLKFSEKIVNGNHQNTVEMILVNIYEGFKNSWADFEADKVSFSYPKPSYNHVYTKYFNCSLAYSAQSDSISFKKSYLSRSIEAEHSYLKPLILEQADKLLSELNGNNVTKKVQDLIIKNISTGKVNANFIADRLNITVPTLYRYLKKEGTIFHEILKQCQIELARKYILTDNLPIIEVAFLLGFSESSSFIRAFKKWTDSTPKEYKNNFA